MRICIPTNEDNGLSSTVCAHFGSAPWYLIVDSDSGDCLPIANDVENRVHGGCTPLQTLEGHAIDVMAVGGIGRGALNKLSAAGIDVYVASETTVAGTVAAWKAGRLQPVDPGHACAGHGHGNGSGNGHGHGCHHG